MDKRMMDAQGRLPLERKLRESLEALGPASRKELQRILILSRTLRDKRIGELYANRKTRIFAEMLMDVEDDPAVRTIIAGELRGMERRRR